MSAFKGQDGPRGAAAPLGPERESISAGPIPRERLTRRIIASMDKKLVLLRAPAGYGKTTALRAVRETLQKERPDHLLIWAAAPAGTARPSDFANAVMEGCAQAGIDPGPSICEPSRGGIEAAEDALASLMRRLDALRRPVALFVDEIGAADDPETGRLLKLAIQRLPPAGVVLLAARAEPRCGGPKLRLEGKLAEFTREDLAFTDADVAALFSECDPTPVEAASLAARAMGWPAALKMAKIMIGEGARFRDLAGRLSGDMPGIADYIEQEIFEACPEDLRGFVCETSILPYVDRNIAEAVLERRDSDIALQRLRRLEAFVFPDDGSGKRLRHHPLYADFLRARLYETGGAERVRRLHSNASRYFERGGQLLYAIDHALFAEDDARRRSLFEDRSGGVERMTEDFAAFERVMGKIEEEQLSGSDHLKSSYAFYCIKRGDFDGARKVLEDLEKGMQSSAGEDRARRSELRRIREDHFIIDAILSIYTDRNQDAERIAKLRAALLSGEAATPLHPAVINNALGVLLVRRGELGEADARFEQAIAQFRAARSDFSIIYNSLHRAHIAALNGDMARARQYCSDADEIRGAHFAGDRKFLAMIDIAESAIDYERGALHELGAVVRRARADLVASGDYWVEPLGEAFRTEAKIAYCNGDLEAACNTLGEGLALADGRDFPRLRKSLLAAKAALALIDGDARQGAEILCALESAEAARADRAGPEAPGPRFEWREDADWMLARVRLQIAAGEPGEAARLLDVLEAGLIPANAEAYRLKAGTLRALVLKDTGEAGEAGRLVRMLVERGEALDMRAFFLEEGAAAHELLDETARQFSKTRQARAFNEMLSSWLLLAPQFLPPARRRARPDLNDRQLEILALLADGYARNDIAARIATSAHNVNYHLNRMFDVFGVSSSIRLLAEARRHNLVGGETERPDDGGPVS